jgi:hypothetical protein
VGVSRRHGVFHDFSIGCVCDGSDRATGIAEQAKGRSSGAALFCLAARHDVSDRHLRYQGRWTGRRQIASDSYLFVDRQPGTYTLKVEPPFDFTYFETEVQVAAGGTYYYAISVRPGAGGAFQEFVQPHPGTQMQPKGGGISFASIKLNSLDPATAAAEIAKLDAQ